MYFFRLFNEPAGLVSTFQAFILTWESIQTLSEPNEPLQSFL